VAGEHEVERAAWEEVEDVWEVAQQNAELRRLVDELPRMRTLAPVGARVDADDLHSAAADVDGHRLIHEQARRGKVAQACGSRKGITRVLDVVVPEHGERHTQAAEQLPQPRFRTWTGNEVARDRSEIGTTLRDPVHRGLDRTLPARGEAEVEVGEMCDPQPDELLRQPGQPDVQRPQAHPAGLEPAPGEHPARRRGQHGSGARTLRGHRAGTAPSDIR
jgi:hypothetical protein